MKMIFGKSGKIPLKADKDPPVASYQICNEQSLFKMKMIFGKSGFPSKADKLPLIKYSTSNLCLNSEYRHFSGSSAPGFIALPSCAAKILFTEMFNM